MVKKIAMCMLLLCSVVLVGCDGPIKGTVIDSSTEEPIEEAFVFLLKKSIDWEPGYVIEKIASFNPGSDADVLAFINEQLADVELDDQDATEADGSYSFADKDGKAFYGVLVFKTGYRLDFAMVTIDFLGLGLTTRTITLTPR